MSPVTLVQVARQAQVSNETVRMQTPFEAVADMWRQPQPYPPLIPRILLTLV